MGYRSTVAFIISFETREQLDNYLAPRLLDEHIKNDRENFSRIAWDDASVMYYSEEIKWYDEYEDVRALTKLYKGVIEAGGAYRFIRVGEDDRDIDDESGDSDNVESFYDDFYPVTTIQTPTTIKLTFGEEQ